MLAYELHDDTGILIMMPEGPLERNDFEPVSQAVDEYIVRQGALNGLMIYVDSFPWWEDFDALISHVRFVRDNSADIDRVATVTDSKILTIMPRIVDRFVSAEIRHFEHDEKETAMVWLSGHG